MALMAIRIATRRRDDNHAVAPRQAQCVHQREARGAARGASVLRRSAKSELRATMDGEGPLERRHNQGKYCG